MLDNGISVYGFNISLSIPPYDYLDVDDLAGRVITGALGDMLWLTQRLGHKTVSEHELSGFVQQLPCAIRNPV